MNTDHITEQDMSMAREFLEKVSTMIVSLSEQAQRLDELTRQVNDLATSRQTDKEYATNLENELYQARQEVQALRTERDAYRDDIGQVRNELAAAKDDLEHYKAIDKDAAGTIDSLHNEIARLNADVGDTQRRLDVMTTDYHAVNGKRIEAERLLEQVAVIVRSVEHKPELVTETEVKQEQVNEPVIQPMPWASGY